MTKILVIEDDRIMRTNIAELLEISGYEVQSAPDGKIGVEVAQSFVPDLIICDVMMPKLDGFGVLHLLNKQEKTAAIPFIFLTAKSEKADFRKGMELGADDYLTKPFEDIELLNAVESRLKRYEQLIKSGNPDQDKEVRSFLEFAGKELSMDDLSDQYIGQAFKAREFLFRDGDHSNYLYYVKSGQVKTYRLNDDGKELITQIFNPGDFFGYRYILEDRPHDEYASMLKSGKVYKLPRSHFLRLMHDKKEVSAEFVKLLARNLSEKSEELIHLAYSSVRKRIARQITALTENNASDTIQLSRTDLSKLVGTSKETLVRILSELKNEAIIETDGADITVLDPEKLHRIQRAW